jgi:hypothetical protein
MALGRSCLKCDCTRCMCGYDYRNDSAEEIAHFFDGILKYQEDQLKQEDIIDKIEDVLCENRDYRGIR